jgi:hypothetical protein
MSNSHRRARVLTRTETVRRASLDTQLPAYLNILTANDLASKQEDHGTQWRVIAVKQYSIFLDAELSCRGSGGQQQ